VPNGHRASPLRTCIFGRVILSLAIFAAVHAARYLKSFWEIEMKILLVTIIAFTSVLVSYTAGAHPSDAYEPRGLPAAYGTEGYAYGSRFNFAEIIFQEQFPDPDALTDEEKYIVSGTAVSSNGDGMPAWNLEIFMMLERYERIHGYLPTVLDEEAIRSVLGDTTVSSSFFDKFRSPLTEEFPRVDALDFSPGDIYCRKLTENELDNIAQIDPYILGLVDHGEWVNPETGQTESAHFATGVYYIRIYGWNDVIYESIQFGVSPTY
jgi:hypothetical protein